MAARITLPYAAPAELLPAPLPTVADILAAPVLPGCVGCGVVSAGEHYAVKYGKEKKLLQEGESLLFVQQSSNVPVPRLYALFHDDETNLNFIVQELIPGTLLSKRWRELSTPEKQDITSQLRRHMDELRSIPSPGYYGGVWRQPIQDCLFAEGGPGGVTNQPYPDSTISGPQVTEEAWTDAMWRLLNTSVSNPNALKYISYLERPYLAVFKGHHPVFTHGDFQPVNIILRDDGQVVIIDWEKAGWYPSYWEYCTTSMADNRVNDWGHWIHKVLDEYFPELGWMRDHRGMILEYGNYCKEEVRGEI